MSYIYNPGRFKQAALLKGSEKLGVYSSDIDLAIDLGGRAIVFVELKTAGTPLGYAQKKLFLSLIQNSAIPAFLIVASHYTDTDEEICPNAFVEEIYWRYPEEGKGFQYYGYDMQYDGDLLTLNHFLSYATEKFCPRLLNRKAELPACDNREGLETIFGNWQPSQVWEYEWIEMVKKKGLPRQALTESQKVDSWTDEMREAYLATVRDEDGRFWYEKYMDAPEGPKEPPTAHVVF